MARVTRSKTPSSITSKTNVPVLSVSTPRGTLTPVANGMGNFRQRLEKQLSDQNEDSNSNSLRVNKTLSPTLEKLRMTPGRVLQNKQTLILKHAETRQKSDTLSVGGGVAMWPQMEKMRLSQRDTLQIFVISLVLLCMVLIGFNKLHGDVILRLLKYNSITRNFKDANKIDLRSQEYFHRSLKAWHQNFRFLLEEIQQSFDVSNLPLSYSLYILCYIVGMAILVYYLYDNMFAKSKLSPRRIRRWVWLLVVIGTWTLSLSYLLVLSYMLEMSIQTNVRVLHETLGDAILKSDLNKHEIESVILYWNYRCLPPVSMGTLSILGLVAVQDVIHYLQYYSLPVITVLFTPIVSLIMSLYSVYHIKRE